MEPRPSLHNEQGRKAKRVDDSMGIWNSPPRRIGREGKIRGSKAHLFYRKGSQVSKARKSSPLLQAGKEEKESKSPELTSASGRERREDKEESRTHPCYRRGRKVKIQGRKEKVQGHKAQLCLWQGRKRRQGRARVQNSLLLKAWKEEKTRKSPELTPATVSYTHLTLPTRRTV